MSAEAEAVQETVENPIEEESTEIEQEVEQEQVVESREEERVPLSALQKERRKRQEAEKRADWMEQLHEQKLRDSKKVDEPDEDEAYEPVTKADIRKNRQETIKELEERQWIRENPEKAREVNENLKEFLKKRAHLGLAIESAPNRYEEAWTLMDALTPKQKVHLKNPDPPKKQAPGSPSGVPKAAAMNESVDVMKMTDEEFNKWRGEKIKLR